MIFLLKMTVLVFWKLMGKQASCYESDHTTFIEVALPCSDTQRFTVFIAYFWYIECNFFFFFNCYTELQKLLKSSVVGMLAGKQSYMPGSQRSGGPSRWLCFSLHPAQLFLHFTALGGQALQESFHDCKPSLFFWLDGCCSGVFFISLIANKGSYNLPYGQY